MSDMAQFQDKANGVFIHGPTNADYTVSARLCRLAF